MQDGRKICIRVKLQLLLVCNDQCISGNILWQDEEEVSYTVKDCPT